MARLQQQYLQIQHVNSSFSKTQLFHIQNFFSLLHCINFSFLVNSIHENTVSTFTRLNLSLNALVDEVFTVVWLTPTPGKFMQDQVCIATKYANNNELFPLHVSFKKQNTGYCSKQTRKTAYLGEIALSWEPKMKPHLSLLHFRPCSFTAMRCICISEGRKE